MREADVERHLVPGRVGRRTDRGQAAALFGGSTAEDDDQEERAPEHGVHGTDGGEHADALDAFDLQPLDELFEVGVLFAALSHRRRRHWPPTSDGR